MRGVWGLSRKRVNYLRGVFLLRKTGLRVKRSYTLTEIFKKVFNGAE